MTEQPKHDAETSDLRGSEQIVAKPNDIGDLPNPDSGDMRGPDPELDTDPEANHRKKIIGAVVAAVVVGGVAVYGAAMWNATPQAPDQMARVATASAPAARPQQIVVQPAAPIQAAPANEVVQAPVHVAKRPIVPSRSPVVPNRSPAIHAVPIPVSAPAATTLPEIVSPASSPLIAVPQEPTQALPEPPATNPIQVLPDPPAPPVQAPQPTATEPPQ